MTVKAAIAALVMIISLLAPLQAQSGESGSWKRLASRLRAVEQTYRKWGITVEFEKDYTLNPATGPALSSLKVAGAMEGSDTFKLDAEVGMGNRGALGMVVQGVFKTDPNGTAVSGGGSIHVKGSGIGGKFQYTKEDGLAMETGVEETFYSLGIKIGGDGRSPISLGLKGGPVTIKIDPVKWVQRAHDVLPEMVKKSGKKVGGVLIQTDLSYLGAALRNSPPPDIARLRDATVVSLKRLLPAVKSGRAKQLAPITTLTGVAYDRGAGDVLLLGRVEPEVKPIDVSTLTVLLRSIWREGLTPFVSLDPDQGANITRLTPRIGGVSRGLESSPLIASMLEADYRIKSVIYGDTLIDGIKPATTAIEESREVLGAGAARFWFTPRPFEHGDIRMVRTSARTLFTFDTAPQLLTEAMVPGGASARAAGEDSLQRILAVLAAQITARLAGLERTRAELGLTPLRQAFEVATLASLLRKEPPPAECAALLRKFANLPVGTANLRESYEPVRKSLNVGGLNQVSVLWGGANASVKLDEIRFRTERSIDSALSRLQGVRWKGWSAKLSGAFAPVVADAEPLDRKTQVESLLAEAHRLIRQRRTGEGIEVLARAIDLQPESVEARLLKCYAYLLTEQKDEMLRTAEEAVKLAPRDARSHYWHGIALTDLERHKEGLASAEKAVGLDPKSVDFLLLRAACKRELFQMRESIADFDAAVKLAPRSAFALFERGLTYARSRKFDKAIADYTASLAINPRSVQTLTARAQLYFDTRQYERGVADYARITEIKPTADTYAELSGARLYTKEFRQAVKDGAAAIQLDPRNPMGHMARGLAHKELKEFQKAIDDLENAYQLFPAFRDILRKRIDECKRALGNS